MKRKIDIEKLLQWALREELPKGRPVSMSAWEIVQSYGRLGARIDVSGHGGVDQFGFVPGAPHEDALTVSRAIGGLSTCAQLGDDDDIRGLFADRTRADCVPAEWIVALRASSFNQQSLVISKAMQGLRPAWRFEVSSPQQVKVPERNAVGAYRERALVEGLDDDGHAVAMMPLRGRAAMKAGAYDLARMPRSPLVWSDPSPIKIGEARGEYLAWFAALSSLAIDLRDELKQFEPTAPAVAWRPWITGQTPGSRVLSDGIPAGLMTVPLPLQPKRRKAGPPVKAASDYESAVWRAEQAERAIARNAGK